MTKNATITIALDRSTVRHTDRDGHLHVSVSKVTKAKVDEYLGREIPNYEALGLDANKVYSLLRDPSELAKAATTLNGKPLLDYHIAADADDHPADHVVGTMGTDAKFDGTYLTNSMTVWVGDSIDKIQSRRQHELSCGYHYTADMTPGTFDGVAYDGVMRDIAFNHLALVENGRVGPDAVVGDSRLEMSKMITSRKALVASGAIGFATRGLLTPKATLALDAAFDGVTGDNFVERREEIADAVLDIVTPLLAKDKALDRDAVLGALDMAADTDDDDMAGDEAMTDEEKEAKSKKDKADKDKKMAGDKRPAPKPKQDAPIALDAAAIRKEVADEIRAETKAHRIAMDAVKPHVGEDFAITPDTAAGVYRLALDAAIADGRIPKTALAGVDESMYGAMVRVLPLPNGDKPKGERIAMDEATSANDWFDTEILGKKKG